MNIQVVESRRLVSLLGLVALWTLTTTSVMAFAQSVSDPNGLGSQAESGKSSVQSSTEHSATSPAPTVPIPAGVVPKTANNKLRAAAFVPLDSWVYPVLDRAIALGLITESFSGIRPLTRMQCAVLVQELGKAQMYDRSSDFSSQAYGALQEEFGSEIRRLGEGSKFSVEVDSIYARGVGISGPALNDGYHFGTTFINDYGRPSRAGLNSITGFSLRTTEGPMAFYLRGEYQRAPASAGYSSDVMSLISNLDGTPVQSEGPVPTVNRFRTMEAYVAFELTNLQFTIGKQDLAWGQSAPGAMLVSNHAEPLFVGRITNIEPVRVPVISRILGACRGDFFFGQLAGHQYPKGPWIHGQKITFHPTANLELGFSRTVIFAGEGKPLTFRSFWRSFASVGNHLGTGPDSPDDVGDRRGGFDLKYRLPKLRNHVTVYLEGFTDDDPSPLSAPHRSGWNLGVYLPRVPGFEKLDLRIEGAFTDLPEPAQFSGKFFYWNGAYRDSHTNEGSLLGSWVGRQGHGVFAKSTYWLTPRHRLELQFRRGVIDDAFIPNGGKLSDFAVSYQRALYANLHMSSGMQYERWRVPVLTSFHRNNISLAIGIDYRPSWRVCCTNSSK
jgi:hypothetical protein